jgi:oxalate decarboxylase/phosphoglucose isomerase-like protein (cupin superfamily)
MGNRNAKVSKLQQVPGRTPPDGGGTWHRLIDPADTEAGLIFGFGRMKPGEGRGWHIHPPGEDEIFYVIEGEGLAEWKEDGEVHREKLSAGTALYTPGNMENNVTNVGTKDLLSVYCIYKPVA